MRSSRATKILTWLAALVVVVVLGVLTGETRRARSSSIYINEVLLLNRLTNVDEDGGSAAWVEVHNASAATVDLTGFALTNDPTIPHKWRFPTRRLPPGGHLIAWCSGKDRGGDSPVDLHTNFELTRGGETVILTAPDGSPVDAVALLPQTEDRSYGRLPDATGEFRYLLTPTPGSSNEGPASQAPMPSRPRFHPEGGAYHERLEVEVSISLPVDGYEIRYTTDGSLPDAGSLRYPGPIVLVPGERGNKILRAAAFYDDARVSQVETHSYFSRWTYALVAGALGRHGPGGVQEPSPRCRGAGSRLGETRTRRDSRAHRQARSRERDRSAAPRFHGSPGPFRDQEVVPHVFSRRLRERKAPLSFGAARGRRCGSGRPPCRQRRRIPAGASSQLRPRRADTRTAPRSWTVSCRTAPGTDCS